MRIQIYLHEYCLKIAFNSLGQEIIYEFLEDKPNLRLRLLPLKQIKQEGYACQIPSHQ